MGCVLNGLLLYQCLCFSIYNTTEVSPNVCEWDTSGGITWPAVAFLNYLRHTVNHSLDLYPPQHRFGNVLENTTTTTNNKFTETDLVVERSASPHNSFQPLTNTDAEIWYNITGTTSCSRGSHCSSMLTQREKALYRMTSCSYSSCSHLQGVACSCMLTQRGGLVHIACMP